MQINLTELIKVEDKSLKQNLNLHIDGIQQMSYKDVSKHLKL